VKRNNAATERQLTPAAQLRREGRLARIAKALASGATVTDIAEAEGISRTIASRTQCELAGMPATSLADFVSSEYDEMHAVFYRCVRAVEHALSARREYMSKAVRSCTAARTITPVCRQLSTSANSSSLVGRHPSPQRSKIDEV
jgi:hypothetical protein